MLTIKQMKYFVEIVAAGSYSRAAEHLFVAQSALSRHIKELESALQTQLLERGARHVELTDAGRLFHERCKRILQDIADAVAQTRHVGKGEQGTIRMLNSSSVTLTASMGARLNRLLNDLPGVALDISKASSEHQAIDIEEDRADLGLVRLPILRKHPNIVVRKFFSERLMVVVSRHHPLAARAHTDIDSLRDECFVSIPHPDRGGLSYLVADLCLKQGFFPKVARATSRKTTLLNLVEANFGIAIVPESMREIAPPGVCFLTLPAPEAVSVVGLIHRRAPSPIVHKFVEALELEMENHPHEHP